MADAFGEAGGGRLDVDAVQHLVEQKPLMPPHTRRSRNGEACQSSATVKMPAR